MNAKNLLCKLLAASVFGLGVSTPHAEDIDLYTGGESITGAQVNVLLVLDNSTNWAAANQGWPTGKQGESELEAISEVAGTLTDSINLGLLMATGSDGGYVRFAVREMNDANRPRFQSMLNTMRANFGNDGDNDDKVNTASVRYDNMLNASFRYFNGKARFGTTDLPSGSQVDLRDYNGNNNSASKQPAFPNALGGYSLASVGATTYIPPAASAAGCASNYIIFIGNGYPSQQGAMSSLSDAAQLVGITNTDTLTAITTNVTNGDNTMPADEWTRFMYTYGIKTSFSAPKDWNKISTYTIDVCKDQCDSTSGTKQGTLLKSMAKVGGGKYFRSTSKQEIKNALALIFAEIQAVNSVFASATLPISVNTQGTYENQVYIGVFRPDGGSRPRWFGNLKEYKFGRYCDFDFDDRVLIDSTRTQPVSGTFTASDERVGDNVSNPSCGTSTAAVTVVLGTNPDGTVATRIVPAGTEIELKLYLADQLGYRAIDETNNTGFIDLSARSYWTTDSTFWSFMPSATGSVSDSPDGPAVERGAAGQRLRTTWAETPTSPHPDGRKVYTCLDTTATSCLGASATAANKALSANPFTTTNSEVTGALVAPGGAVSVTLARSGNTVTATSGTAHGFNAGDNVVIAGATPADYNGTKTVLSTTGTTFTYTMTVSETPATSVTGTLATTTPTINATSITLSGTTPGTAVTATVTGASAVPAGTTSATIANAKQSFLNGLKTGTTNAGQFQFSVTLPAAPAASGGSAVTATCCSPSATQSNLVATYNSTTGRLKFDNGTSNLPGGLKGAAAGTTVVITNATAPLYNGTWEIVNGQNKYFEVQYAAVTPDAGTGKTITPAGTTSISATITRPLESSTAAADTGAAPHGLAVGATVTISDVAAPDTAYNGNWTVLSVSSATTLTFGPVPFSPATSATGTITAAPPSAGTGPTTANLINWMRGKDLWEDENLNGSLTDVRASIHGDVLHSRPAVVNYGGTIGIVGFYGSNDGYLRAIHGGISNSDGEEKWAFIPKEFANYIKLSRLYQNKELIRFPNTACTVSPTPTSRNYFWDGSITVYQSPNFVYYTTNPATTTTTEPTVGCVTASPATCYKRPEKTYIYSTMRRGGRAIYALDVSVPDDPKFLWKVDNTKTGFSQLGYTWSEPKLVKIKGNPASRGPDGLAGTADDTTTRDVLVFGAGYDPTDDDQPSGCPRGDHTSGLAGTFSTGGGTATCPTAALTSYSGIGRGVFIVDAMTGALVNFLAPPSAALKYSFPADVTTIDLDGDGAIDRIYAADSGAQLFRFDVDSTKDSMATDAFTAYFLAKFGDPNRTDAGTTARNSARKFLYPPEVVPFTYKRIADGVLVPAMMVLAGTGDREKPLPNRNSSGTLNTLTCSGLYSSSSYANYFGAKLRDKFFGLIDKTPAGTNPATVTPAVESNLWPVNTTTLSDTNLSCFNICYGFEIGCEAVAKPTCTAGVNTSTYKGWVMNFKNTASDDDNIRDEEKLVSAPRVVSGTVLFGTNTPKQPSATANPPVCSNLGQALAYAMNPFSGMPTFDRNGDGVYDQNDLASVIAGGGLPPTVTAGVVGIGDSFYRFVIGGGGSTLETPSSIAGAKNPISLRGTRSRVYWYYPADDQ
jgi:type IV pilus assembly protein PilY1